MKQSVAFLLAISLFLSACNDAGDKQVKDSPAKTPLIKEETVSYKSDSVEMKGYVAYDGNMEAARPAVLVIPEWWGLNDYAKSRARDLAKLGYIAMAVDMYGDGKIADNPKDAGEYSAPFYQNPEMAKARFDAARAKLLTMPEADSTKVAAIGYCFGGGMVLNVLRLGEPLKAAVSFHGNLMGAAPTGPIQTDLLICHGKDDQFVKPSEVEAFKKQMDSLHVNYQFIAYDSATHAFTNPEATAMGKKFNLPIAYNAKADSASWEAMKELFAKDLK